MSKNSFSQGLITGLALGALAGLMNAKRPGYQTRQLLKEKIDRTTQDVNDVRYKVNNLSQSLQRLSTEGATSIQTAIAAVEDSLDHFKEENSPRLRRINQRIANLQEDLDQEMDQVVNTLPPSLKQKAKNDSQI
ncbi:YtxH domain-containing protein [Facklamia languida]|uniref:Gas vesicle protein n=1 Tax=Facklamia languida CCUG 37842 TaxID=883113 RepID=H3NH64_9LACT|nr:YtxH domain-containing protein [Facklamia languida]EHR38119.1 hypothetical protein HMPREF9708_00203 [Facklamia languida CCUG 37842]